MPKQSWQGGALLAPVPPVLVTCGTMEQANIITIAWTGMVNTRPPMVQIAVRPTRYSYPMIRQSGEFVVNLTTAELVKAADLCGVRSGRDGDKFALTGLTKEPGAKVSAPLIAESPVNLECRVAQVIELGSHHLFLAHVEGVQVDEQYLDAAGKLHLERCGLAAYCHGEYFALGKSLGHFGFSVRKKAKKKRR